MKLGRTYRESNCHGRVFGRNCCIRGYYVYKEVWEAAVGEALVCEREPENASDRYAVAVKMVKNASKAVAGVFAVFATGRYYRMYSNWAQKVFS